MVKRGERENLEGRIKAPGWIAGFVVGLVLLIIGGLGVKEWRSSQFVSKSQYRFNMAMIVPDIGVTFVSFDPADSSVLALPFPQNLAITSRSKGEYSISSLYKLGSYEGEGGMFARQKIQGFMRVPVPGYVVVQGKAATPQKMLRRGMMGVLMGRSDTSLSKFDALVLLWRSSKYDWRIVEESELVRAAVIEKKDNEFLYHPERLQEYVGTRLFDWGIGAEGLSVAIINASGENGLGSDIADFLSNLGMDVVMVRSVANDEILETSQWQVESEGQAEELGYIFEHLFGFDEAMIAPVTGEYRARVLVKVGKDAKELF